MRCDNLSRDTVTHSPSRAHGLIFLPLGKVRPETQVLVPTGEHEMFHRRLLQFSLLFFLVAISSRSFALGECGLSCCLAGTNSSGVTLAENFGLSVQYEYSDMTTIRNGTGSISPNDVIDRFWTMGNSYAVPTQMTMEKLSFIGVLPVNERWQLLAIAP